MVVSFFSFILGYCNYFFIHYTEVVIIFWLIFNFLLTWLAVDLIYKKSYIRLIIVVCIILLPIFIFGINQKNDCYDKVTLNLDIQK